MGKTKELKTNKGITLIALVITIIVMLILVAVTISMAVNGGLFNYAGKAVGDTRNALNAENELANGGVKVDGEWYNSIDEYLVTKNLGGQTGEPVETISKTESYVGYYADVDGNGTADGVIYADLAVGGSGNWGGQSYSHDPVTGTKDYYINGIADGPFGNGVEVLTATGEGNDRFYVMALTDLGTTYYTFYASKLGDGISASTSAAFGRGYENTATMLGIWTSDTEVPADNEDLWGQLPANSDWFVPSIGEWCAFGTAFDLSSDVDSENYYENYGLKGYYWTSSLLYFVFLETYGEPCSIETSTLDSAQYVRLSTTF